MQPRQATQLLLPAAATAVFPSAAAVSWVASLLPFLLPWLQRCNTLVTAACCALNVCTAAAAVVCGHTNTPRTQQNDEYETTTPNQPIKQRSSHKPHGPTHADATCCGSCSSVALQLRVQHTTRTRPLRPRSCCSVLRCAAGCRSRRSPSPKKQYHGSPTVRVD